MTSTTPLRIAVLGGGHGSYAAAADLTEQGHSVALWRRSGDKFGNLAKHRRIDLTDSNGSRSVPIDTITADLGIAMAGAQLVLLPSPAFAQESIATALAPHCSDGQVVFLPPGTFGAVAMPSLLRRAGCMKKVLFAETGTLPYLARKHSESQVTITMRAVRLPTGVFPAAQTSTAIETIGLAYPSVHPVEDALSGALMNAGPIIHPPLILMNAGPLEHLEHFDIHNEGTQPAVRRVTDALDNERIAIREALGYQPNHYPLSDHYETDQWMYGDSHQRLVDSGDWRENIDLQQHRYMTEDIAYGLAFLESVGRFAQVQTPLISGMLAMGRNICGGQFMHGERTLQSIGLDQQSRAQLATFLTSGFSDG